VPEAALLDPGGEVLELLGRGEDRTGLDQGAGVLEVRDDRVVADEGLVLAGEELLPALAGPGAELRGGGAEEVEAHHVLAGALRPVGDLGADLGEVLPG